jgi:predicted DNA-binding transcriptional regulator AlpA
MYKQVYTWKFKCQLDHRHQMHAEGQFPQRIKLGQRAVGWLESEAQ